METKANFVLIGAATVLGILGLLGLLVWLAKVEIDQKYAWYEVLFDSVSGLSTAADVRYNGLSVGQVTALNLDADDPSKVRVRIEVAADTPIKTDTVAQLNSQGVTGVSYVALSGGSADSDFLQTAEGSSGIPVITSEPSLVQALTEDAPDLVTEAIAAIKDIRNFLSDENRQSVTNVLKNLESASGGLETALSDFSNISRTVSDGTAEISKFTGRLDEIGSTIQTTLENVNDTLDVAKVEIAKIGPTMEAATGAFDTAETTIGDVDTFIQTRIPQISDELSATIVSIEKTSDEVRAKLDEVLSKFGGTADLATDRLVELETSLSLLDQTLIDAQSSMAAVESASVSFQTLVDGEGAALVDDARVTLKSVQDTIAGTEKMFQEDIPEIVSNVRVAVANASEAVDQVSANLTSFSARLDPLADSGEAALNAATQTLSNANRTLANLDDALSKTGETMEVAKSTFANADTAITTDLGPAIADVRTAAGQFETTMAALSGDIPAIAADLRSAMARALAVIENIDGVVSDSAPPIKNFAETGLPEFTRFAREAQALVTQLEQLARKMERDPARFFFGNNVPEYRR